ncbi:PREDICTED: presenilins-associated rhomboid-like protein, mitochondrial [Ceratosolen solmsi marchali]|uniref:rhomboid protease n=1 Tax=Ceratosolen solmsi marchali TaxID=326594 RepID=A0AAJ6YUD3_9HYME|nr:PREDICTED: presenilins-associated rhomboid-like protein, mitochondrial [Ceratosolen solmsi marchali]
MEYERVRRQNQNNKYYGMWWRRNYNYNTKNSGLLQQIKYWWNNLSHGETIFFSLLGANVLVFLSWKIPKLQPFMFKYFTHQTGSNFSHIPSVLSMFSHCNAYHLIANMYALYTFITPTVHYLGPEHFIALYLTSGVVANLFSTAYKLFTHQASFSLGASGAIMGVIGYFCNQFSDTKLSIIFLPFITLNADMALKSLILLEITGCLFKWKIFDHAAHLGGALFGMFWYYWGIEYIWKKRTTIMMYWHAIRNPPKSH